MGDTSTINRHGSVSQIVHFSIAEPTDMGCVSSDFVNKQILRSGAGYVSGESDGVGPLAVVAFAAVGAHPDAVIRFGFEANQREGNLGGIPCGGIFTCHFHLPSGLFVARSPCHISCSSIDVVDSEAHGLIARGLFAGLECEGGLGQEVPESTIAAILRNRTSF